MIIVYPTADYLLQPDITQTYMSIRPLAHTSSGGSGHTGSGGGSSLPEKRSGIVYPADRPTPVPVVTENMLNLRKSLQLLDNCGGGTGGRPTPQAPPTKANHRSLSVKSTTDDIESQPDSAAYVEIPAQLPPRQSSLVPLPTTVLDPDDLVCLAYASVTSAGGRLSLLNGGKWQ